MRRQVLSRWVLQLPAMSTATPLTATTEPVDTPSGIIPLMRTALTLLAFLCAATASVLAGTDEVIGSLDPTQWSIHRSFSLAAAFWLCIGVGALALILERRDQDRRERALNAALYQARNTVGTLESRQQELNKTLEHVRTDANAQADRLNEALRAQDEARADAESKAMARLNELKELQETLPPDNLLTNYALRSVSSLNLLVDALRTPQGTLGTSEANDRIRSVLGWMAALAQLYAHDPTDVVFGAFVSLYYESVGFPAEVTGWSGTVLPPHTPIATAVLVDSPELSVRLEGAGRILPYRDLGFEPGAWPVPPPGQLGRGTLSNGWIPGPQEAFVSGKSSQFDDLTMLGTWVTRHHAWSDPRRWQMVENHLDRWLLNGIRSVVSYPLVQYDAATNWKAQLGTVTVYATESGVLGNDIQAERLANLLSPLRAIIAGLLIRRAEADPSRWIPYERPEHWHGC
jgi:hypothetical protein